VPLFTIGATIDIEPYLEVDAVHKNALTSARLEKFRSGKTYGAIFFMSVFCGSWFVFPSIGRKPIGEL
jgi:hypothetical protein